MNTAPRFNIGYASSTVTNPAGYAEGHKIVQDPGPGGGYYVAGLASPGYPAGYNMVVARFNADGTVDATFGNNGVVTVTALADAEAYDMAIDASGNLVLAGGAAGTPSTFAVVRLLPDGTADTSFGGGDGIALTSPTGISDFGDTVLIQPDGRIIVTGNGGATNDFVLIRLNADGTPDTTFGSGGAVQTDITGLGQYDASSHAALMADGRIVVVGRTFSGSNGQTVIARYNSDGSLDASFNASGSTPGIVVFDQDPGGESARGVTVLADGTIVVVGSAGADAPSFGNTDYTVLRLDIDGNITAYWREDFGISEEGRVLAVQPDGKILVAGFTVAGIGNVQAFVARFDTTGGLDPTFGNGAGYVSTDYPFGEGGTAHSLLLDSSGDILVSVSENSTRFVIFRLNADGSAITTFGQESTLDGSATHVVGGPAVVMDASVQVFDDELDELDDYSGASLTVQRNGGASPDDGFEASGNLATLADGGDLELSGNIIGSVSLSDGILQLYFDNGVTRAEVNEVLSSLAYKYLGTGTAPAQVTLAWTFDDGDPIQPETAEGQTTVLLSTGPSGPPYAFDWSPGTTYLTPGDNISSIYFDASQSSSGSPNGYVEERYLDGSSADSTVAALINMEGGPASYAQTDGFIITGVTYGTNPATFSESGHDTIITADGNDIVRPMGGQDVINTNGGDDIVVVTSTDATSAARFQQFYGNTWNGGTGTDRIEVSGAINLGGNTGSSGDGNMARALFGFEELRFTTASGETSNTAAIRIPDITDPDGIHLVTGSAVLDRLEIGPEPGETFTTGLTIDLNTINLNNWNSNFTNDWISLSATNAGDTIIGHAESDGFLGGRGGDDIIMGSARSEYIWGGSGSDVLSSGGGNDNIQGDGGDLGADGYDYVSFAGATNGVNVDLGLVGNGNRQNTGWGNIQFDDNIEGLIGSGHNDILGRGYATNVTINGGAGNDTINTYGGEVGLGFDVFDGGDDIDTISFQTNTIFTGLNVNLTTGRASFDAHGGDYSTLSNIENVIGSNVADSITGDEQNNELSGGGGNDTIYGKNGLDTLHGGEGNDKLYGENDNDTLYGDNGNDTLYGAAGDDDLYGGDGTDVFYGGVGQDDMFGGAGTADIAYYNTSTAGVTVNLATNINTGGDAQGDTLDSIERVQGSNHADSITGNGAINTLYGNGGSDTISGGMGADLLFGGADSDSFVFAAGDSGQTVTTVDQIKDYAKGAVGFGDEIDFSAALSIGGSSAAATASQASIDALTGIATFAAGSGRSLVDVLADITARFTASGDSTGDFALFRINNAGDYYAFISDGLEGVTSTDTVIRLNGITSVVSIDLSGGDLTLLA
jgi:uncharacterized delta-60 repeat protein